MNFYKLLPNYIISRIARERDIVLYNNPYDELQQFDEIFPEYILCLSTQSQHEGVNLLIYAAMMGVDLTTINHELIYDYALLKLFYLQPEYVDPRNIHNLDQVAGIHFNFDLTDVNYESVLRVVIENSIEGLNIPKIEETRLRKKLYNDPTFGPVLDRLYQIRNLDDLVQVLNGPVNPIEKMLVHPINIEEIMSHLGINIPPTVHDRQTYLFNNIHYYANLYNRNQIKIKASITDMSKTQIGNLISKLSDIEIFNLLKAYVAYNNRQELVINARNILTNTGWFMSLDRNLSTNQVTIMGTDLSETDIHMLSFGTIDNYVTYELDDLFHAFHKDDDGYRFRKPENLSLTFTLAEIHNLKVLLNHFNTVSGVASLKQRINEIESFVNDRISEEAVYMNKFNQLSSKIQNQWKEFLYELFYSGMYMRQWKGPGHPYPCLTSETRRHDSESIIIHEAAHAQLIKTNELLLSIPTGTRNDCLNMKVSVYDNNGFVSFEGSRFDYVWKKILAGKFCIRIGSRYFIGTAYRYLRIIFHETVPNFDVKTLEAII